MKLEVVIIILVVSFFLIDSEEEDGRLGPRLEISHPVVYDKDNDYFAIQRDLE